MIDVVEPKQVMKFFYELEQIPRESGNEKGVSDYLVNFAKERNLEVVQDAALNVIIRKAATPGYENRPAVILQGHMDMVCEKTPESTHDFLTDPIELIVDGEWLHAKDTTLGADNGVAVAMALAILDSDDIEHGPLEVLITTAEETGMDGALAVDGNLLHGKYLLNIDTEEEGEFVVSCAGGCRIELNLPTNKKATPDHYDQGLEISVDGLHGGHSGIEIYKQRANANQLLARTLYELRSQFEFDLASFSGGSKHNAIPRQAKAVVACKAADVEGIKQALADKATFLTEEFTPQEEQVLLPVKAVACPEMVYDAMSTSMSLIQFLYVAPHGVIGMSQTLENLVDTSLNLAIVKEVDDKLVLLISLRSLRVQPLQYLQYRIMTLGKILGFEVKVDGSYPAWEYERGSELEAQTVAIYEKFTGNKATVTAIHAGLECGLLKAHLPHTEMISFGPTIKNAHTPQERLHLPSTGRIFDYLKVLLKELK